jgi:putative membrane protein
MINIKRIFNFSNPYQNTEQIILRDYLALERTKLANERTLLSYIRSSLYLLIGGIALIQLEGFQNVNYLGYLSLTLTIVLLIIGVYRFRRLNRQLVTYYNQIKELEESKNLSESVSKK